MRWIREVISDARDEASRRMDSAFFVCVLDYNIGEKNVQYPDAVSEYKKRRQRRKDSRAIEKYRKRRKARLDADDDGRWVTTENDHKIHLNEEGVPDKGNPHVLNAIKNSGLTREQVGRHKVGKIRSKVKDSVDAYKKADDAVQEAAKKYQEINTEYQRAERRLDHVERIYKKTLSDAGIKEGDRDKLAKEVAELEKKYKESPYYDRDAYAAFNNKSFLLSEYDECYGEETKEMQRNLPQLKKKNDDAKKELDGHIADRNKALSELKEHTKKDVQNIRFYSDDERQKIRDDFINSSVVSRLTEEDKAEIAKSIDGASDAQLSVLQKTSSKARIMSVEETATPDKCSHYLSSNGIIYLQKEDMSNPRVFWHEYGHFMDDFNHSGMEDRVVTFGEGSAYESHSRSFSDILERDVKVFGKDGASDLQDMLDSVAKGKFKIDTNSSEDFIRVLDAEYEQPIDFTHELSFTLQKSFDRVISDYINGGPDGGELEEYYKSIGFESYDKAPKFEDYFEYYVTPKRKLERKREKYKGAEEEFYKKLGEFFDRQEQVINNTPNFRERESELHAKRRERESHISAVCDCLCGALGGGRVFSIYGCHERDYYRTNNHALNEWSANIHQMMFSQDKEAIDLLTKLMPRTMKKVKSAYNEYLWRNLSE